MELKFGIMSFGHFPNIPSINILKGHILTLIRPVKGSIFNIHDPIGLRYLFYLRVGLSPLRSHKTVMDLSIPVLTNVFVTMVLKTLIIFYSPAPFSLFKEQPVELV